MISFISAVQCCVTMLLLLLLLLQLYHIRRIRLSELSSMLSPSPFWFVVNPGLPSLLSLKMSDGLVFLRSPSSPIPLSVYHFALTLFFHYREYRVILTPCSGTACWLNLPQLVYLNAFLLALEMLVKHSNNYLDKAKKLDTAFFEKLFRQINDCVQKSDCLSIQTWKIF